MVARFAIVVLLFTLSSMSAAAEGVQALRHQLDGLFAEADALAAPLGAGMRQAPVTPPSSVQPTPLIPPTPGGAAPPRETVTETVRPPPVPVPEEGAPSDEGCGHKLQEVADTVAQLMAHIPDIKDEIVSINDELAVLTDAQWDEENAVECSREFEQDLQALRERIIDIDIDKNLSIADEMWVCADLKNRKIQEALDEAEQNNQPERVPSIIMYLNKATIVVSDSTTSVQTYQSFKGREERLLAGTDAIISNCASKEGGLFDW
jgi:hypothetical protein